MRTSSFVKDVVLKHKIKCLNLYRQYEFSNVSTSPALAIGPCIMISVRALFRLLSIPGFGSPKSEPRHTSRVRHAMLSLLQAHGGHSAQRIAQRVRFANDLEALWYLRQDLMSALVELDGEAAARRQLHPINTLFKGRLPGALGPRVHHTFSA